VVCLNEDQAAKDRHDREAIVAALEGALKLIFYSCVRKLSETRL
jgi:hypothetical protein